MNTLHTTARARRKSVVTIVVVATNPATGWEETISRHGNEDSARVAAVLARKSPLTADAKAVRCYRRNNREIRVAFA